MDGELIDSPRYRDTMARLEAVKKATSDGGDYWLARDIEPILGYASWGKFEAVVARAEATLEQNGLEPSHHFVQTGKVMGLGKGGKVKGKDYFLSRAACYLIAMNGDPTKPEIAAAQAYFVVQTRFRELDQQRCDDEKRLELRKKVTEASKQVSKVAKDAGVRNHMQGVFHDARYQGLYGMALRQVKAQKGLESGDSLFDHAGPLELSANEFQMNLAADVIRKEGLKGEQRAIRKNEALAADVRRVIKDGGGTMPEDLPLEEPIQQVKKRLKNARKSTLPPTAS